MAKLGETITLVSEAADPPTDPRGFQEPAIERRRKVYANMKSVGSAEFYESAQAGMKAELKFVVRTADYRGEEIVEHGGKRYGVLRTYETASDGRRARGSVSGEFTELTVSDLGARRQGGGDG